MIASRTAPKIHIVEDMQMDPPFITVTEVSDSGNKTLLMKWGKLNIGDVMTILEHANVNVEHRKI